MTRIQFVTHPEPVYVEGKGEFPTRYAPGCFDRLIGSTQPWNYRDTEDGPVRRRLGIATVVAVEVNEDGTEATWTVDYDPAGEPEAVRVIGGLL